MQWKAKLAAAVAALGITLGSATPSYALGELENVTLTVYVNPVGAPQAFLKDDLARPLGIDVDIIYELQRRLLFNLKENRIFPLSHTEGFKRLKSGQADIVIGGISYTFERSSIYDFTPIFYSSSLAVLYNPKRNPDVHSEKDIRGKRIGVEHGTVAAEFAEQYGANLVYFTNNILASFQVSSGELDGLIYDRPPIADLAHSIPSANLSVTDNYFGDDACQYAFALAKNSPYTEVIANTMEQMMMDGTIDAIMRKWHIALED